VGTIAAAGSALEWVHRALFSEMNLEAFFRLVRKCSKEKIGECRFEPYLAGDRMSMEVRRGAFENLSLGTSREEMLVAVIDALAKASAERLRLLLSRGVRIKRRVVISGGTARELRNVLQRDWGEGWTFEYEDEATLRGLSGQLPLTLALSP